MAYDFSSLDSESPAKAAGTNPAFGFQKPNSVSKYDFSSIDAAPDTSRAQAMVWNGSFSDPTREAEKHKLARELKAYLGEETPPAILDPEEARRKVRAAEMDHGLRQSDSLRQWVEADAGNAGLLARSDVKTMTAVDSALGMARRGAGTLLSGLTADPASAIYANAAIPFKLIEQGLTAVGAPSWLAQSETGNALLWAARESKKAGDMLAGPKPEGNIEGGVLSGIRSLGTNLGTMGATLLGGWGPKVATMVMSAIAGGQSALKAFDANASASTALSLAATDAVAEYATEAPGMKQLFAMPGLKQGMMAFVKSAANFGVKEMGGEQIATAWQDFNEWALLNPEKTFEDYKDARPDAAIQTAIATIVGGGGQIALMQVMGQQRRSEQRALFDALHGGAQASELRQNLPEKYRDFVAKATADGPLENLYIPVERFQTYFQAVGIDPAQAARDLNAANYGEASTAGSDVMIPTADFATTIAGTDHYAGLIDDVRLHQGDLTARELAIEEANREQSDARLQEQIAQLVAEGQQAQGLNAAIDTIVNDVEGQLVGSGVELSAARTQAQLLRGVAVMAERAFPGQDPVRSAGKLWAKYGLTVRRDLPAVLTQIKDANLDVDPLLDMLRASNGPTDAQTFGQSLVGFLRSMGGLKPLGELQDVEKFPTPPGQRKIVSPDGLTLDDAAMAAQESGYFQDTDHNALIEAIFEELNGGTPAYSMLQTDERAMGVQQSLSMLNQAVKDAGIDLNAVTDNAEVRRILEQSGPVAGARFNQPKVGAGETAVKAKEGATRSRTQAIADVITALEGKPVVMGGEEYTVSKKALNKMTAEHGEAGTEKPFQQERIVAIQSLRELAAQAEVISRQDDGRDPQVDHIVEGRVWMTLDGNRYLVRLLGKVWTPDTNRANKMHSMAIEDVIVEKPGAAHQPSDAGSSLQGNAGGDGVEGAGEPSPLSAALDPSIAQLNQGGDAKRGYLQIGPDRQMKIGLTESANLSTFLHEIGHFYLEMLGDLAEMDGVNDQIKQDYASILQWMGVENRAQIETRHHEMFARANEAYLMEGNAPAPALQGAFQRFKAWLTAFYLKIENLDVKLSPEVRDVFERIYATDQEIMAAQDQVSIAPMFLDAATAKMSEAEFAAYAGEVAQVTGAAKDALLAKLMREFQRGKEQWWKAERAQVQAEVAGEVDAQPVYQAFAALTAGALPDGTPIKLARADLAWRYGEDFAKNLPRNLQRVYAAEGGTDTDTAAEMLGFASGDDLVKALADMRPRKALIEAETDARMRDRYGDLMTDGTIEQQAQEALHNDKRADVLMVELRALRRRQKDVAPFVQAERDKAKAAKSATVHALDGVPPLSAFRRAAAGRIEQTAVRDLNPHQYLLAGRKAAKQGDEALARQDAAGAATAKQRELLNHYLYLEATKAKAEAQKIADYANSFDKATRRQSLAKAGKDYLEQIDALLERFEFKAVTLRTMDRRTSLAEFIAAKEAAGETFVIPGALIEDANVRNWRQASVLELRGLHDALRNLAHLASFKNQLLRKKAAHDFALVKGELMAALDASYPGSTGEAGKLNDKADTAATKAAAMWRKFDAAHIKVEQLVEWMDGGKSNGPWARFFFDQADDAQAREYDLHAAVTKTLQDLSDAQSHAWRSGLLDKTSVRLPGIDGPLSRYDLLSIAMNVGNESNYQRLREGRGWTEAQIDTALAQLNAEDARFVQGVWDTLETLWPEIAALQERVAGVAPDKIEPRTVTLADGTVLRGGYFPVVYDPKKSAAGEKQADATQSVQDFMARGYGRASTDKGHTKARIEGFAAPLLLDFEQVLTSHLSKVIKDISHREAIIGLTKILKASDIKAALIDKIGEANYTMLTTWEQTLISDRADTLHQPLELHNALFRGLRTHTAIVTMGWKISTMMSQLAGFGPSLDLVKPKYMTAALRDFVRHPGNTLDFIAEKSGEMRHRSNNLDRDVKDALLKTRGAHGILVGVQRSAFYLTAMADRTVSAPTWLGGYRQALAEGMSEEDAVRYGDRAVRLSQGAGGAKDLAAVQRNSELMKLLTMYYTPFSVLYARLRDMGHATRGPRDLPRLAARSLALVILPAVLGELLAGRGADDDEDKIMWAARKALLYPFASMPVIRDLVNWQIDPALAKATGGEVHFQPGYKLSPVVQAVEKIGTLPSKVIDGWTGEKPWDDVAWNALETSGYIFGLPTAQPRITGEYLWDLFKGDAAPADAGQALHDVLFRRPIERR